MHSVESTGMGSLAGVRILDLTHVLSGPFCTQMLGDLGADVIKVEGPSGDLARKIPPHFVGEDSVYYLAANRNKRSLVLDLKSAGGRDLLRRLALASDVVVENFRPGVLDRLGLRAEELRGEKPALIWCSITGFGQTGPYRDKPAFDMIVQALAGGMSLTGEETGLPVRAGIPIGDLAAGMYAAVGILAALHRRGVSGRGEQIDVAMLDCQAALLGYQAAFHMHSGMVPGRQGRAHESIASYGAFSTSDGCEIVIAAWTQEMWVDLTKVMGRPELAIDPRFLSNETRREHKTELWAILEQEVATRSAQTWLDALDQARVPAARVNTVDQVVADPQLTARGMVVELAAADGRRVRVMGDPILMKESARAYRYPPAAGEHSADILSDVLGLARQEIDLLVSEGAVMYRDGQH